MNARAQSIISQVTELLSGLEFLPADGAYLEGDTVAVEFVPEPIRGSRVGNLEVGLIPPGEYPPIGLRLTQQGKGDRPVVRETRTDTTGRGWLSFLLLDIPCMVEATAVGDYREPPTPEPRARQTATATDVELRRRVTHASDRMAAGRGSEPELQPEVLFPFTRFSVPAGPQKYRRGGFACQIVRRRVRVSSLDAGPRGAKSRTKSLSALGTSQAPVLSGTGSEIVSLGADAAKPFKAELVPTPIYFDRKELPFVGMLERSPDGTAKITVVVSAAAKGAPREERARRADIARGTVRCQLGAEVHEAEFREDRGEWRARMRFTLAYEEAVKESPEFHFELPPAEEK